MSILAATLSKYYLTSSQYEELTSLIRTRILSISSPEMIYIFGSYARGTISGTSDLDLAIIFENQEQLIRQKKIILNSKLFLDYSTDLLFFTRDEFEKKSALGAYAQSLKTKVKLFMTKEQKFKKEYAFELLKIAEGDLETTKVLLSASIGRKENVCFNAQQVIEKSLKAILRKLMS